MKSKTVLAIAALYLVFSATSSYASDVDFKLEFTPKNEIGLSLVNETRDTLERAYKYFYQSQQPNGSWVNEKKPYTHTTPMAIIILGTPHRYIPVYQE